MPLKRTPPKMSPAMNEKLAVNILPTSSESLVLADSALNRSASDSDLSHAIPQDFVSQRKKRSRAQMEESISTQMAHFKEEIRKLMTSNFDSQAKELKQVHTALKEIQNSNYNIENTVSFLAAQNEEFKQRIVDLETQAKKDRNYITILESKIEEMQMASRKSSFEIKNVPKTPNENKEDLLGFVTSLSKTIDCTILKSNITDIYRKKPKSAENKSSPIVVETNSTLLKNQILKSAKIFNVRNRSKLCAKHLGIKVNEDTPIYLSEHLTPKSARLYFLARDLAKTKNYKFCWTAYGKVYVRENEHFPIIMITHEAQVQQLMNAQRQSSQAI